MHENGPFIVEINSPVDVNFDVETGVVMVSGPPPLHPSGCILPPFQVQFSPSATRQLVIALKEIEAHLGKPIEDLIEPDIHQ